MKKEINRLRTISFRYHTVADNPSHKELRIKSNAYGEAIILAKYQHWSNYLEEMTTADIWLENKFIKELAGDRGCPRIPTLKSRNKAGEDITTKNNKDKAKLFAKTFFPPPPPIPADQNLQTIQSHSRTHRK